MPKSAKKTTKSKPDKKVELVEFEKDKKVAKKIGKKSTADSRLAAPLGTARGIESMFRNSYRAQLDMISLAATKANIMISVNSSVLALLTFASAYVFSTAPAMLIPMGIFLIGCIVSIFSAVLAARPQRAKAAGTALQDFREERADLLVFEYFAQLSKEDYMTAMMELIRDKERVYKAMIAHLHFLGRSADRRFRLLQVSYSAFITGLVACFAALAIVGVWQYR